VRLVGADLVLAVDHGGLGAESPTGSPVPRVLPGRYSSVTCDAHRRLWRCGPRSCWPARAGDRTHAQIAADLGCNPVTVGKWPHRFAIERLDGLVDAPRPGAARNIGDDVIEAVVVEMLETGPPDANHWSTRGLERLAHPSTANGPQQAIICIKRVRTDPHQLGRHHQRLRWQLCFPRVGCASTVRNIGGLDRGNATTTGHRTELTRVAADRPFNGPRP
jgi:Homeodomain-like domain